MMIHTLLLFFGVGWGIVICVMLISMSVKAGKGMWLVTMPGVLIVVALAANFTGHMLHLPHPVFPHQRQVMDFINFALQLAILPLLLIKLYGAWSKRRVHPVSDSDADLTLP